MSVYRDADVDALIHQAQAGEITTAILLVRWRRLAFNARLSAHRRNLGIGYGDALPPLEIIEFSKAMAAEYEAIDDAVWELNK